MARDKRAFAYLSLMVFLFLLVGCGREPALEKTGLLPEASASETNFSPYQPKIPYAQMSANLLGRQIFQASGPKGTTIKILDLYVLPTRTADNISLPGAAVLDVRYGEGRLVSAGNTVNLSLGATASVAPGALFSLQNAGESALIIRARIIVAS